jgi:cob(I)alamin adenosyltransferase
LSTEQEHTDAMKARKAEQDARVRANTENRGVIVVHTGDGKGKSTAAFGVAIRAAGHGQRVGLVQFIKGKWKTGEQQALTRFPEVTHVVSGNGFTWNTQDRQADIDSCEAGWAHAVAFIQGGEHDVVILDELNIALDFEYLPMERVVSVLANKPEHVSVIVTGRNAKQALIDVADTVSEHRVVKHAFESGIRARKGVEF